jgi:rhomboid family GlyGly-CTERM serine protease
MGLHELQKDANLRHTRRWGLVLGILVAVLQFGGEPLRELLAYEREGLQAGQAWRLLSGHFVHLGWSHLALNVAGLAIVVWLVGHVFSGLRWMLIMLLSIAAIDAGLWFLNAEIDWYVGLSGMLHGLLVAGLFVGIANRDREALILSAFVLAKIAWEQFSGPLPGSESTAGGVVIVDAHLYGAFGGLLGALLCWRSVRQGASI